MRQNKPLRPSSHPKILFVEGEGDRYTLTELLEATGIFLEIESKRYLVDVQELGGWPPPKAFLATQLKTPNLNTLGLVVDADDSLPGRWEELRCLVAEAFPELPDSIPGTGLITQNANHLRLGVWIMPDNQQRRMLETFLSFCLSQDIPVELWNLTERVCMEAKTLGATFKDVHNDKARIHTWLAWQNEPGMRFGEAARAGVLRPHSPTWHRFHRWFCEPFDLPNLEASTAPQPSRNNPSQVQQPTDQEHNATPPG